MTQVSHCDVLVVGAGPAGGVCAAKLAKTGLNVICIDKGGRPGSAHTPKIDITENKGIEETVKELKLSVASKTNKSVWFSPNSKFSFVSSVHDIFFLRGSSKNSLDYSIHSAMKRAKVKVLMNSFPLEVEMREGNAESVLIKTKKSSIIIKPKIIAVATGEDNFFKRKMGFDEKKFVEIIGFGALVSNLRMQNKSTSIFFDSVYAPGGYFFVGKVSNSLGMSMLVANKALLKNPIKDAYKEFIKKNPELYGIMLGSKTISLNGGERKISKMSKRVYGNIAFIGDAARTMSPVFAYGVNPAIRSSDILVKCIQRHGLKNESLQRYEKDLHSLLGDENQRHFLRKVYDSLNNEDYDFLVETANYLHSKQHLDELIDTTNYNPKHILFAILRKPHKTLKLTAKIMAKMLTKS